MLQLICDLPLAGKAFSNRSGSWQEARGSGRTRQKAWGGIAQAALRNKERSGTKTQLSSKRMAAPLSHARTSKVMVRTEWF